MKLKEFCRGIRLAPEALQVVEKMDEEISEIRYQYIREVFWVDQKKMFREISAAPGYRQRFLYYYCRLACETYEEYQQRNIGEKVFFDTFSDISLWCDVCFRRYGEYGLQEYEWLWRHIKMTLFRLGRFQFERTSSEWEFIWNGTSVKKGDTVISIHIPEGDPITQEKCLESLKKGQEFWKMAVPYLCHSWLLYPGLQNLLGETSNIRRFQKLFDIAGTDYKYREGEERIFGMLLDDPSGYPEYTRLQKEAKKYLEKGGKLGSGLGILKDLI